MKRRVLGFGDCCYHIVSRINERRYYLRDEQKQHFLWLLHTIADFSGIEIITYSIMDDHFHLLVRVPSPKSISDKELLRRIRVLYQPGEYEDFHKEFTFYKDSGNEPFRYAFRQRFLKRMYNLSEFMRTLKLRFSIWYNKQHDREGPLWTGRFKSALIQSSADEFGTRALSAVAAYIDLNAVRANLVKMAEEYPWCGVAQAVLGDKTIQKGLRYALGRAEKGVFTSRRALKTYKKLVQTTFLAKIGDFSSGWIIGKASFVDFVARQRPECFKTGLFDITERILALPESDLYKIKRFVPGLNQTRRAVNPENIPLLSQ